ncbi:ATP-grasp domain-containing protein [Methylophilus sp. YYY-1]|uniref:ATP-grasp domain-containing protein n=1 Tax=Methylophilus sp. YYY-1 TaxID=2682087 RepID=UPI0023B32A2A|nr:ATP-grasp domain-containing protein [Methylophilus sp. YYY-1]
MRLAILSHSARIYSQMARREGFDVLAVDAFADAETRQAAQACFIWPGFDNPGAAHVMADLFAQLDAFAPEAVVFGSGFEANTKAYQALCERYPVYANAAEVVMQVKDPLVLQQTCERSGVASPMVTRQKPVSGTWLYKQIGACGGGHVQIDDFAATGPSAAFDQAYWQAFQAGQAVGLLFIAQSKACELIGVHALKQRPGGFTYAGASRLHDEKIWAAAQQLLNALLPKLNLVGLNSLDAIWVEDTLHVLEINPRLSASMRLYSQMPLIQAHLASCQQAQGPALKRPAGYASHCMVYAQQAITVGSLDWPEWVEDRPTTHEIAAGQPVCSLYAEAETACGVRAALQDQKTQLEKLWGTYVCKHIEFNIH